MITACRLRAAFTTALDERRLGGRVRRRAALLLPWKKQLSALDAEVAETQSAQSAQSAQRKAKLIA